jgi:uncharacterized protein (DUF433 family)
LEIGLFETFCFRVYKAGAFYLQNQKISQIMNNNTRITRNPLVMGGKPCIRGMRITVGTITGLIAAGKSKEEVLKLYPYLEEEDICAALSYACFLSEAFDAELQTA